MKTSPGFKAVIQQYLNEVAANDPLFAETLKKEGKNIDDCLTYILNCAKKGSAEGYADAEVFGWAVHYYDEDDIKVGSPINAKVIVNHNIDLSPEEKEKAVEKAKKAAIKKLAAKTAETIALNADDVAAAMTLAKAEAIERHLQEQKDKLRIKAEKKKTAPTDAGEQQISMF